ncbi:hypothetical protein [Nostoc sp. LPT]|nr:hypothetical protein [Nostoc sp. LPT]
MTDVLQIHDFCCNDLSFNDRKFMVEETVRKALAEDKEASQEKPA